MLLTSSFNIRSYGQAKDINKDPYLLYHFNGSSEKLKHTIPNLFQDISQSMYICVSKGVGCWLNSLRSKTYIIGPIVIDKNKLCK